MRFPVADEKGDYLLYHRFTGFPGYSAADVKTLVERGSVLNPFSVRVEAESDTAEMFSLDPIDLVAGDGEAVFFSPFKPVSPSMWGKPSLYKAPGAAFRLSDIESLNDVSVRPRDFMFFYNNFIDRSGVLQDAYMRMEAQVEDIYNRESYLEPLGAALAWIRTAEQWNEDVFPILDALGRTGRPLGIEMPQLYAMYVEEAAQKAVEFVAEFSYDDPLDYSENEALDDQKAIEAALIEQYEEAWHAWDNTRAHLIEVLSWGPVPMDKAYLVFDPEGVFYL